MMKKIKKSLVLIIILLHFHNNIFSKNTCFKSEGPPLYKTGKSDSFFDSFFSSTTFVSSLVISSILFITDVVIFIPSSPCALLDASSFEEKEQLIFMALNYDPVMQEIPQRKGEFASIAIDAMGCAKQPEVFYDIFAENFDEVFREEEYGLAYAIRANRILNRQKICEQNTIRHFLTAMDEYYSKEYPNFPYLPPKVIVQNQKRLQKIAEEYDKKFSLQKTTLGKK